MIRKEITEYPDELADLVGQLRDGTDKIILTKDGKDVAILYTIELYNQLIEELEDLEDIRDAEYEIREHERTGESIPIEEIMREFGMEDEIDEEVQAPLQNRSKASTERTTATSTQ